MLERLGPPEEIVAAASPPAVGPTGRAGKFEIAAIVVLALPFVGWLVGIPLVLVSRPGQVGKRRLACFSVLSPFFAGALRTVSTSDGVVARPAPRSTAGGG